MELKYEATYPVLIQSATHIHVMTKSYSKKRRETYPFTVRLLDFDKLEEGEDEVILDS